jgi:hypothetical protein
MTTMRRGRYARKPYLSNTRVLFRSSSKWRLYSRNCALLSLDALGHYNSVYSHKATKESVAPPGKADNQHLIPARPTFPQVA